MVQSELDGLVAYVVLQLVAQGYVSRPSRLLSPATDRGQKGDKGAPGDRGFKGEPGNPPSSLSPTVTASVVSPAPSAAAEPHSEPEAPAQTASWCPTQRHPVSSPSIASFPVWESEIPASQIAQLVSSLHAKPYEGGIAESSVTRFAIA